MTFLHNFQDTMQIKSLIIFKKFNNYAFWYFIILQEHFSFKKRFYDKVGLKFIPIIKSIII